ncbi:hypothetical protein TCAL_15515, partial [Tigriopus californicus]
EKKSVIADIPRRKRNCSHLLTIQRTINTPKSSTANMDIHDMDIVDSWNTQSSFLNYAQNKQFNGLSTTNGLAVQLIGMLLVTLAWAVYYAFSSVDPIGSSTPIANIGLTPTNIFDAPIPYITTTPTTTTSTTVTTTASNTSTTPSASTTTTTSTTTT